MTPTCWLYWMTFCFEMIFIAKVCPDGRCLTSFTLPKVPVPRIANSSRSSFFTESAERLSTSEIGPIDFSKSSFSRYATFAPPSDVTTTSHARGSLWRSERSPTYEPEPCVATTTPSLTQSTVPSRMRTKL